MHKQHTAHACQQLPQAPHHIDTAKEIAIQYHLGLAQHYNNLTPQERVFIYYMFRASLPGNRIAADLMHHQSLEIIDLFQTFLRNEKKILETKELSFDTALFMQNVRTFLVYLWGNHGQYFLRESAHEKRTPTSLGLLTITKENLRSALALCNVANAATILDNLEKMLFDAEYQSTNTVPDSIEKSGGNFYAQDFTSQDYLQLSPEERSKINAYFYIDTDNNKRIPRMLQFSTQDKYGAELSVALYWLTRARDCAQASPEQFDAHVVAGLDHLIMFLKTGDESWFKKHSIEWLKSTSKVDYCFGFIEAYHDPKSFRGFFQAEATIRTFDISKLNAMMPGFEAGLPFPVAFKRQLEGGARAAGPVMNASMNTQIFGTGGLGPLTTTAAYCLPNYEDIRSEYGSKQIIYPASKGLGALLNGQLAQKLFFLPKESAWLAAHDTDWKFFNDLWDVHCILHETLGHGSGKLAEHTFRTGDALTVADKTYQVGDTISVTNDNLKEFLAGYEQTLEELRAEIIALYVSIKHLDQLVAAGFLAEWHKKLGRAELTKWLIFDMANTGIKRIMQQSAQATEITGDHARANCTIMNYLIHHGGIALQEAQVSVNGTEHTVLGLTVTDSEKCIAAATDLMQEVQRIKSTGDGQAVKALITTYGTKLDKRHQEILKKNDQLVVGDLRARILISPRFDPIVDSNGVIVDINASWPKNIFEQQMHYADIAMQKV